jgi:hypothetical protein
MPRLARLLRATSLLAVLLLAQQPGAFAAERAYSPPVSVEHPVRVYWGDTHLHTTLSGDANERGTGLGPDDAYRFAKGERVTSNTGQPVRLDRPLDFLMVSDHANNMGAGYARARFRDSAEFRASELGRLWAQARDEVLKEGSVDAEALDRDRFGVAWRQGVVSVRHEGFRRGIWSLVTAAADRHNDPGRFTAFIGYEWTPSNNSQHRVVIFRDDRTLADRIVPFSSYDSANVEDLWRFLADYERTTGGAVFAIPHNPNLTTGTMFAPHDSKGAPIDLPYIQTRARWEPLAEVTQVKGDSETHPFVSPDDPFADFETWNGWGGVDPNPRRPDEKIQYEYARPALKNGLDHLARHGANPFKFGMIGSTDDHTGLSTAAEDNYFGKFVADEPSAKRHGGSNGWERSASGYAGIWAHENTRESLFEAMRRRETYASTGPRITLRFFGGWDFTGEDVLRPDYASIGYRRGVPMGGDLAHGPAGHAPTFMVHVARDPLGANLDRVQVVKGWRATDGSLHERVYDVAWSPNHNNAAVAQRSPAADGSLPPIGTTVDVADASYTNAIGSPELSATWTDPDFDAAEHAFYYVRALEIPTPRWTAYDAKFYGIDSYGPEVPMVVQDRVYSSPIWYTAAGAGG